MQPAFEIQKTQRTIVVRASGSWSRQDVAAAPRTPEAMIAAALDAFDDADAVRFLADVSAWDSMLLAAFNAVAQKARARGLAVDASALPDGMGPMLDMALAVPPRDGGARQQEPGLLEIIGEKNSRLARHHAQRGGIRGRSFAQHGALLFRPRLVQFPRSVERAARMRRGRPAHRHAHQPAARPHSRLRELHAAQALRRGNLRGLACGRFHGARHGAGAHGHRALGPHGRVVRRRHRQHAGQRRSGRPHRLRHFPRRFSRAAPRARAGRHDAPCSPSTPTSQASQADSSWARSCSTSPPPPTSATPSSS